MLRTVCLRAIVWPPLYAPSARMTLDAESLDWICTTAAMHAQAPHPGSSAVTAARSGSTMLLEASLRDVAATMAVGSTAEEQLQSGAGPLTIKVLPFSFHSACTQLPLGFHSSIIICGSVGLELMAPPS